MEARDIINKVWGTHDMKDLSEFNVPLDWVEKAMNTYAITKIQELQDEVHKITGDGEIMQKFNVFVGSNG